MASRPTLIGIGLAVVAVAAVVLVIALGRGGEAGSVEGAAPVAATDPAAPRVRPPAPTPVSDDPAATSEDAAAANGTTPYREYVIDGKIIRDHRKGNHPTPDLPPSFHPPNAHRVAASVTRAVSDQVKAAIRTCTQDLPPEARGPKPKIEGQVVIGITGGKVSVSKATVQLRDVVGAGVDPIRTCIEEASLAITAAAPDEPDVANYAINLSLTVL